jgi:hypothetical protein
LKDLYHQNHKQNKNMNLKIMGWVQLLVPTTILCIILIAAGCETEVAEPTTNFPILEEPVRGMESFMERHGEKPYELFLRGGELLTHRVIFEDRDYGTEVWMIDDSPTVDHAGTASVWPAWNADASLLYLSGMRLGEEGPQRWFVNADYTRLIPEAPSGRPVWDRENPDIYFIHRAGELIEGNARTGQTRTLATWEPYPRADIEREQPERTYGLTRDNRYIFFDTPNAGERGCTTSRMMWRFRSWACTTAARLHPSPTGGPATRGSSARSWFPAGIVFYGPMMSGGRVSRPSTTWTNGARFSGYGPDFWLTVRPGRKIL